MDKNSCKICKRRAYITCDQCDDLSYFCSRGHLHEHKLKRHQNNIECKITKTKETEQKVDMRKMFEHLQNLKQDIDNKINSNNYVEAILNLNKCLNIAKKFYESDHLFV